MTDEQQLELHDFIDKLKIKHKVEISSLFSKKGVTIYITYNKKKYFEIVENVYNAIEEEITNKGYNTNCDFLIFMISDWKKIDKINKK